MIWLSPSCGLCRVVLHLVKVIVVLGRSTTKLDYFHIQGHENLFWRPRSQVSCPPMLKRMRSCIWILKYLLNQCFSLLVCLTNDFPFLAFLVKVEKHLKMLRVTNDSFSLPRVWRHRSYIGRMTRVKSLTTGPQKHILELVSNESKSPTWILQLATLCAWDPTSSLPSCLRQFASFLHLQFKSLAASSTLQVQGSSQRCHHVNNFKDANFFKPIMVLEDQM